ncbi:molybdopterin synthase catalytic subunit [Aureimonas altamirensis]|uniref:Molybdopterin synthase catalytic subunit n=1 Tax=Aureimonas altamirensis TaxID=370622 RepID=A0A0B1Q4E1_9HYPH|nr:molybdenum cofactor biosynthesis protein MoaE [Aureimonas altamirensis]KHJ54251.1 molybdopterin synthase catalytic subunit [Aureimonas altamirensis]
MALVRVQAERIDFAQAASTLPSDGSFGALVSFTGYCRDEAGRLAALEIEHYPGMAEGQIGKIAESVAARWLLAGWAIIHRFGMILPGEEIVFVACASQHRQAAFEAASCIMDFMKTEAPFWKREHLVDGSVGAWVEARDTDAAATDRWHRL